MDGVKARYYKYWSSKAQTSMKDHVDWIMESYGDGCQRCVTEDGKGILQGHEAVWVKY